MSIRLSERLEAIVRAVTPGNVVLDVGCDHAHVPIRLLQDGIAPRALAFDIIDGPVAIARENLELAGLSDRCEVRKSDGLSAYKTGEAQTLIIAGMGGIVMTGILEAEPEKVQSFRELILGPQSEQQLVRSFLRRHGIGIVSEQLIRDGCKYYPVIRAVPGAKTNGPDWDRYVEELGKMPDAELAKAGVCRDQLLRVLSDVSFRVSAEDLYGPCLIAADDPELYRYVVKELRGRIRVLHQLMENRDTSAGAVARLDAVRGETGMLQVLVFLHTFLAKPA